MARDTSRMPAGLPRRTGFGFGMFGLPSLSFCLRARVEVSRVKKTVGLSLFVKYFCGPWMPAAARAARLSWFVTRESASAAHGRPGGPGGRAQLFL